MVDVFISYSRTDKDKVANLANMIAGEGYEVWWDAHLPPHMSYSDVITAKIGAAKAAVVVWSDSAAKSEWVRAEADVARNQQKLIQTALDDTLPPLPFNQIQCADLSNWSGESDHVGWSKVKESLVALCGPRAASATGEVVAPPADFEAAAAATPPPVDTPQPPTPEPAYAPAPAPATAPASNGNSNWAIFAGIAVALIALIAAALIVFVALDDDDDDDDDNSAVSAGEVTQPGASGTPATSAPTPEPAPVPVPDRREWMFATVEDSDGFSNVRARPTTRSEIVGTVREGETFSTWRQEGSWWQVELSDGTRGYIYRRLIRLIGNDSANAPNTIPRVPVDASGQVIAGSSSRLLTTSDLQGLNAGALRIARNEIFARKGYRFQDAALRTYFSRFSWYSPTTDNVTLNATEAANVALIRRAENNLGQ